MSYLVNLVECVCLFERVYVCMYAKLETFYNLWFSEWLYSWINNNKYEDLSKKKTHILVWIEVNAKISGDKKESKKRW